MTFFPNIHQVWVPLVERGRDWRLSFVELMVPGDTPNENKRRYVLLGLTSSGYVFETGL